jgi:integrase
VRGLQRGRTEARETEPIQPVADDVVNATLPFLTKVVADMVRFQRLTGTRPGEVCAIRPCDVDRSGEIWIYRPRRHKTDYLGRQRLVFIGPRAQEVLRPYLLRGGESHCFSPAESVANQRARQRARRKTKVQPSQVDRRKSKPKRKPRLYYRRQAYLNAVRRACRKADVEAHKEPKNAHVPRVQVIVPHWHPNQLRHTAATEIRSKLGLEAAQVALGHSKADVTQIYAERDWAKAADVMKQIG